MYGMHPIGVHVVRKSCSTSDSRDKDSIFWAAIKLWKHKLHRSQNRIITTTRTPTRLLVTSPVGFRCCRSRSCISHIVSYFFP